MADGVDGAQLQLAANIFDVHAAEPHNFLATIIDIDEEPRVGERET